MESNTFKFYSDSLNHEVVETKDGKKFFVKGVFANSEKDLVNDVLTPECLADMTEQMKNKIITIDVEHEAFRGENETETELNKSTLPIAKVSDFVFSGDKIEVKAEMNQYSKRFEEVWGSLKGKFLNAFSFAFHPKTWTYSMKGKEKVRMLQKLDLLNITFTGNPVNPSATIKQVFAKSLDFAEREGGNDMAEKKEEIKEVDFSSELKSLKEEITGLKSEVKSLAEKKDEETSKPAEEPAEEKPAEAEPEKVEEKSEVLEVKAQLEETKKELAEIKALLEKPQMKAVLDPQDKEQVKEPERSILSYVG